MTTWRKEGFALSVAVGIVGLTFGVLANSVGLTMPQIMVMSALVFTGASQFAAVSVVAADGSGFAAFGSAMLLAARNALYGPVVARLLPTNRAARLAASHFVIDETTAMASVQKDDAAARDAFWWTAIWLWSLWNLASVAGAVLGSEIADPQAWGLDVAFPAGFVALLAPHVGKTPGRVAAFVGAALAVAFTPIAPAGVPLLIGAIGVVPGWLASRRPTADERAAL